MNIVLFAVLMILLYRLVRFMAGGKNSSRNYKPRPTMHPEEGASRWVPIYPSDLLDGNLPPGSNEN